MTAKKQRSELKNLTVSSVDLCQQGANPESYICLKKSLIKEGESDSMNKFFKGIQTLVEAISETKMTAEQVVDMEEGIAKAEDNFPSKPNIIKMSMMKSIESIVSDETLSTKEKSEMAMKNIKDFYDDVVKLTTEEQQKNEIKQTITESRGNEMDIEKMSPEDREIYAVLVGKYNGEKQKETELSTLNPEVKKALEETKIAKAELMELKKSLEIGKLELLAKKYEILGKNSNELAPKLYELKQANGTIYDEYTALLDEQIEMVNKSGIFNEIGSNRGGSGSAEKEMEQRIQEIRKADSSISYEQAFVRACDDSIELKKALTY